MIIVSQDKKVTTQSLDLRIDCTYNESGEFPDFKKEIVNCCIVDRKYNTILGEYATEERAKEVLQEIIVTYTGDGIAEYNGYISFEMPEE